MVCAVEPVGQNVPLSQGVAVVSLQKEPEGQVTQADISEFLA